MVDAVENGVDIIMFRTKAACRPKEKNRKIALILLSFTAGLIAASFLPYGGVMFFLCLALIVLGITFLRCG